jgi:hypothetical protein
VHGAPLLIAGPVTGRVTWRADDELVLTDPDAN